MAGICEDGAFYTEGLKSGAFTLFSLQKVLGNFYGLANVLKPMQCVFQVDGKTQWCSSPLGYSYLGVIKHSYRQVPKNLLWLVFLKIISALVKLWNWMALLNQREWECDMSGVISKVLSPRYTTNTYFLVQDLQTWRRKPFSCQNVSKVWHRVPS